MKPRETKVNKQKPKAVISAKDKTRLIMLIVFLGTLCIGIIVSTAYAAKLQYDINTIPVSYTHLEIPIGKSYIFVNGEKVVNDTRCV